MRSFLACSLFCWQIFRAAAWFEFLMYFQDNTDVANAARVTPGACPETDVQSTWAKDAAGSRHTNMGCLRSFFWFSVGAGFSRRVTRSVRNPRPAAARAG